ncbi:MAG: large subunit ribosomal protein L32 [Chlamydiales bacterium]|jgi:large subunit ribosomal protein L32
MAHPKRRTSKSAKNKRRSHLALKPIQIQRDPRTGAARLSHKLSETDTHYGFDKGGTGGFEIRPTDDEI